MSPVNKVRAVVLLLTMPVIICLSLPPHIAASSSSRWSSSIPPACPGSGAAPEFLPEPLSFCGAVGTSCCDAAADAALMKRFLSLNVSDDVCAATVKGIICMECQPSVSTEEVSTAADQLRSIPRLCAAASPPSSSSAAGTKGATPRGLGWLLSFGGSAVALAFYLVYTKMFAGAGGGQPATNCNGWFISCCASITCCGGNTETSANRRTKAPEN